MISLLLTARQDSKFLAKFVTTFIANTNNFNNVELLIFLSPEDTWNKELLECFKDKVKVIPDTTELGRGNSHIFYSELAKHAQGEWLWYVCDDHYLFKNYDEYISNFINDNNIDPYQVNVIAPACLNSGRISHILSKKAFELVGFGQHGNVDSYINEMLEYVALFADYPIPYLPPEPVMSDFSVEADLMKTKNRSDFNELEQILLFQSKGMKQKIRFDSETLRRAL